MFNILSVGRLEKRKGQRYLLRAFARVKAVHPEARLVLVGGYGERAPACLPALGPRARTCSDVVFAGFVSDADLPRYHQTAERSSAPPTPATRARASSSSRPWRRPARHREQHRWLRWRDYARRRRRPRASQGQRRHRRCPDRGDGKSRTPAGDEREKGPRAQRTSSAGNAWHSEYFLTTNVWHSRRASPTSTCRVCWRPDVIQMPRALPRQITGPVVSVLARIGVTPNMLTVAQLIGGVIAGIVIANGELADRRRRPDPRRGPRCLRRNAGPHDRQGDEVRRRLRLDD